MGKIAIIVYGEYREFENVVNSWNFLNDTENDVYFSTWDKSIQKHRGLNIYLNEDITELSIRKHIPNAHISILKYGSVNLVGGDYITFHWKNALKMIEQSGERYESIMLTRTDSFMQYESQLVDFHKLNEKNVIYGLTDNQDETIQDIFFIGDFEMMKKFIILLPSHSNNESLDGMHYVLKNQINMLGMNLKKIEHLYMATARPTIRTIDGELTLEKVFRETVKWGPNIIQ